MTKLHSLTFVAAAFLASSALHAQVFTYDGDTQNANLTAHDWVFGSKMWGTIETGSGVGTAVEGFNSLADVDITKFTFTFGDLELTDFLEPTATTAGFELYTEGDASVVPLLFLYEDQVWAEGEVSWIRIDVENSNDPAAVGTARAQLTSGGVETAFFEEVTALSGGTGWLEFEIGEFNPVDENGRFSSVGSVTPVPEPSTYTAIFATGALLFAIIRRRVSPSPSA